MHGQRTSRAFINSVLLVLRIMALFKKRAGATEASSYEKTSSIKQLSRAADASSFWDNCSNDKLISFPSTFTVFLIIANVRAWSFFLSVISDNDLLTTFCNIPFSISIDESTLTSLLMIVPVAMLIKFDDNALKGLCISRKSMKLCKCLYSSFCWLERISRCWSDQVSVSTPVRLHRVLE